MGRVRNGRWDVAVWALGVSLHMSESRWAPSTPKRTGSTWSEWRLCWFSPTACLSTLLCFSCAWGKPASSVRGQRELVRKSCYRKTPSWAMTWKLRLWVSEQALARDLLLVSKPPWGKGDCFCYIKCTYKAALAVLLHPDV